MDPVDLAAIRRTSAELWSRSRREGLGPVRDALIETNLGLVDHLARSVMPCSEPFEDLRQCGAIGLIQAVDNFDPTRGWEFNTYATPMILGAIRRHVRDCRRLVRWRGPGRIDVASGDGPSHDRYGQMHTPDTYQRIDQSVDVQMLIQRLPPRERSAVWLHFLEGQSQAGVAEELGSSQPQVSRIIARALARMREYAAPAAPHARFRTPRVP